MTAITRFDSLAQQYGVDLSIDSEEIRNSGLSEQFQKILPVAIKSEQFNTAKADIHLGVSLLSSKP